jgi:hypothetical protein
MLTASGFFGYTDAFGTPALLLPTDHAALLAKQNPALAAKLRTACGAAANTSEYTACKDKFFAAYNKDEAAPLPQTSIPQLLTITAGAALLLVLLAKG